MGFSIKVEDAQVLAALRRTADLLGNLAPIAHAIAVLGEASTSLRFRTQTAPDGTRWKPSLRAQITGGETLIDSGHLVGSISQASGADFAEWGVNRVYAAIHQFGGVIRPVSAKALRFRLANGGFATVQSVTMPARPFLGVSKEDAAGIVDLIEQRLAGALHAG